MLRQLGLFSLLTLSVVYFSETSIFAEEAPISHNLKVPKDLEGYPGWHSFPNLPLPKGLDWRCYIPPIELAFEENEGADKGPHKNLFISVYFNPVAKEVVNYLREATFPVGSVVVKEKKRSKMDPPGELGAMLKLAKGTSPSTGDWEYLFVSGENEVVRGTRAADTCNPCHAKAWKTDYVFGNYGLKGSNSLPLGARILSKGSP